MLTSLLAALAIWFLTNLSKTYYGVLNVPVTALSNLQGHSRESSNSAVVSAGCRVNGYRLLNEHARRARRPVRVEFDRADLRHDAGDRFYVTRNQMNNYLQEIFGGKVAVESVLSDTLYFTFPAENHKKVPVNLTGDFSYRSQYMASGPLRMVPDSVTVYGEEARLDLVDHVSTVPLFLDDVHETQHGSVRLRRIKGVRTSDDIVSFELPVTRYVEVRADLPVSAVSVPAGRHLQIFPSKATVILLCAFPVGKDPFESFGVYVDYKDFASSLSGRSVARASQLPRGVIDYRVEPAVFDCLETD